MSLDTATRTNLAQHIIDVDLETRITELRGTLAMLAALAFAKASDDGVETSTEAWSGIARALDECFDHVKFIGDNTVRVGSKTARPA